MGGNTECHSDSAKKRTNHLACMGWWGGEHPSHNMQSSGSTPSVWFGFRLIAAIAGFVWLADQSECEERRWRRASSGPNLLAFISIHEKEGLPMQLLMNVCWSLQS